MKVKFRNRFFGPDGNRYKAGVEYEIPDSWDIPKSAKRIEDDEPVTVIASAAAGTTAKGAKI